MYPSVYSASSSSLSHRVRIRVRTSSLSRCLVDFTRVSPLQNGVSRTSRVPHGHPYTSRLLAGCPLPTTLSSWLVGAVHPILYNSLLSATSLPPVTLPRGAVQAGLLSSKPTPFYKYITRPSGPRRIMPFLVSSRLVSSLLFSSRRGFARIVGANVGTAANRRKLKS